MNWHTGLSWLAALRARRSERRADEVDPADMGTAFGLDASFGPPGEDLPAAAIAPRASLPWEHRLTRRSSL